MVKYIPEFNYFERNFEAFKEAPSDSMCNHCEQYYQKLYDEGLVESPVPPNCSRSILENLINNLDPEDFESEDQFNEALIVSDPSLWAESELNWKPRWYQEWYLECTCDSKVLRIGRRAGKSEVMIVECLHSMYTNSHFTVLMVAHFDSAVVKFFDKIREFIGKSKRLTESVQRDVKNPSRIEFKNGSRIVGFSLNPNQSASADKIRGQDANLIVVDELDFIKDDDLDVLFAIKASHPNCKVIAASTPSGARNKFYQLCTSKNAGFKEFWFIAQESPVFNEQTEKFFKEQFTESRYEREVFAVFGEQDEGVFKAKYIDRALANYDIITSKPDPRGFYIFGVDWNKTHGTHIVILSVGGGKLVLVKKVIIPEAEYTQTEGVNAILRLNDEWKPKYIFADRGYGSSQGELIKQYGLRNPGTKLHEKFIDIAMNQHLSVKDPVTGKDVKRPAKPFLVQQTAKLLEDDSLVLPKSEDTDATEGHNMGLVQQMRNYQVINISTFGLPMYSKENEHTLVAYFVACGGYFLKEGDLSVVDYNTTIRGIVFDGYPDPQKEFEQQFVEYREGKVSDRNGVPSRSLDNPRVKGIVAETSKRANIRPTISRDTNFRRNSF